MKPIKITVNFNRRNLIVKDLCTNKLYKTKKHVNKKKVVEKFDIRKERW